MLSVGVAIATARASGLERPIRSLAAQTLQPAGVWVVTEGAAAQIELPPTWHRVPYDAPPFYAEEVAINAAADAVEADIIVLLADMTELEPTALHAMVELMVEYDLGLVSGAYCAHDPVTWQEKYRLPPFAHCGPVRAEAGLVYCQFTGIRQDLWHQINGLDERFAGANGYQDTNLARRVIATGWACWVNTALVAHRADYSGVESLEIKKSKLYTNERNRALDTRLALRIAHGETRAVRLPNRMIPPRLDGGVE